MPHIRLLQITDALSLFLCFGGQGLTSIEETPRSAWKDRVTVEILSSPDGRIGLKPYPFDADPLPVTIPARIVNRNQSIDEDYRVWRNGTQKELIWFEFAGA
jgi:hypothetical protein